MRTAMNRSLLGLLIVCVFGEACASRGTTASQISRRSCAPVDSAFLGGGPVFRSCSVDDSARVVSGRTFFDYQLRPSETCARAVVEFVVDESGAPDVTTAHVVRASSTAFSDAVVRSIASWRYSPAKKDGVPVRQLVRIEPGAVMVAVRAGDNPSPPSRMPRC